MMRAFGAIGLLMLAVACGRQPIASVGADPTLAPCVPAGEAVNMPDRLIEVVPLPVGTRITHARLVGIGPLVVGGFIPGEVAEAAAFFNRELVRRGFSLSDGHANAARAGSRLEGNGLEGSWEVISLADCPGSVSLTISVSER